MQGTEIPRRQIGSLLELDVRNTSTTGITLAGQGEVIDRHASPDSQSYNWVLDFEGRELYDLEVGAKRNEFVPVLKINNGEFYTLKVSENKLRSLHANGSAHKEVGRVATIVGVRIFLDTAASIATLTSDGGLSKEIRPGDSCPIELRNARPHDPNHDHPEDANLFYNAVGHKIPAGGKKRLTSTPLHRPRPDRIAPEASCLIPEFGKSDI